ncbi:hypothetical protein JRQ81_008286 [Phrynocephalus forsythii]|uniref:Uncharacterized protein n=1 Tax=Phrynocephalus forsythii TaxID=171643 RepID=A0A9Q0XDJ0_9SAUR|nr:hypothetical protein JRQ81_008286 [Phrynocephalus forsythii]
MAAQPTCGERGRRSAVAEGENPARGASNLHQVKENRKHSRGYGRTEFNYRRSPFFDVGTFATVFKKQEGPGLRRIGTVASLLSKSSRGLRRHPSWQDRQRNPNQ